MKLTNEDYEAVLSSKLGEQKVALWNLEQAGIMIEHLKKKLPKAKSLKKVERDK